MRKFQKIVALFYFALLSFFVVSYYNIEQVKAQSKYFSSNDCANYSFEVLDGFSKAVQTENFSNSSTTFPTENTHKYSNKYFDLDTLNEIFVKQKVSNFIFISKQIFLCFQTSDIIFPFHLFW